MFIKALKSTLSMAVPMMSTRFVQTLNSFIAMVIMAQLGATVLAASLTISMTRIVVMLICISPLFALGAVSGRQMNEENQGNLPALIFQSWGLALFLAIPCMLLFLSAEPIFALLHQPANVLPVIGHYFHVFLWMMPAMTIGTVNQQLLAGMKRQHWVTFLTVLNLGINGVLCYGLTLGHWGMPAMGVTGAALAPVITSYVAVVLSTLMVFQASPVVLRWRQGLLRGLQWMRLIVKIGWPIMLQLGSEMLVLMIITVMIGWFGEVAMAASQVSGQYMLFAIVPIFGLSEASSIRVGHAIADKLPTMIGALGHVSVLLSIATTMLIGLVFAIFHQPLAHIFLHATKNHEVIYALAITLLTIRIITMLFDGVADVATGLLRGLYDTKYPMLVSFIANWIVSLPLAYLLGVSWHYGVVGVAVASAISRILSGFVLYWRWQRMVSHHVNTALTPPLQAA